MSKNWTILETLKYTRHDWLNRLQLIKGNISLGKTEQAERIMDEIVMEMQQEAMLSNIELPRFAEKLLTHNWSGSHFKVEYELITLPKKFPLHDDMLTEWICAFFEQLNKAILPFYENCLYVKIESTEEMVRFLFEFNGIIENETELKKWLQSNDNYPDQVEFDQVGENDWLIQAVFYQMNG
ncbi:sporulation protein [Siminovitchia terrae]|uniref:Sporulation protein n=1 Tax=Siminovitchia terrae TaxID=1914933 RepID=A0ABQ4KRQ4_SIMTE|nr:Spo0B C-terminal domain-containing protein [Siminovitchia terrae]GIN90122.1 sporulation protein [Siminovitchia terrae]GIN94362.1 sporulation protein [Siminovitchia terrae]